ESRMLRSCRARAKSFPLPTATISTGRRERDQAREVPVHGAVTTEDEDYVCFMRCDGQTDCPVNLGNIMKWLEITRRRTQSEDGGGTHLGRGVRLQRRDLPKRSWARSS